MSTWQRTTGQVDAPAARVHRSTGFLDGAQVVARLEYDPQDPTTAWATVAVDEEGHVAVLAEGGQELLAGPPLSALVSALAQECQGVVTFGVEFAHALPPAEAAEVDDPFDPQIGVPVVAERALLYLPGDRAGLEALATEAQMRLTAVPAEAGHLVLIEDGPALADMPLVGAGGPVLVLQHAADYPALGVTGDDENQHVWGLESAVVPVASSVAEDFADRVLGAGILIEQVQAILPGVDAELLRAALISGAGPLQAVPALGLDPQLTAQIEEFLGGGRAATEVEHAEVIDPVTMSTAVRRRAQEAADDTRRAADDTRRLAQKAADDTRRRAQEAAEDARRIADDARAGAIAFADAAEAPVRTWAPYAAAGADLVVGLLLWRRSGRAVRAGLAMGAGAKVTRGLSVVLLAAAAANVVGAVVDRRRPTAQ